MRNSVSLLLASFILFISGLRSQNLSQSPYGRYALGDMMPAGNAWNHSLGGSAYAVQDSSVLNFEQPASLVTMARGVSVFEGGVTGAWHEYQSTQRTTTGTTAGYNSVALAIPIVRGKWHTGFKLNPISNTGFTLRDSTLADTPEGTTRFTYLGNGGFSGLSFTNSFMLFRKLALGATGRLLFGRTSYSSQVTFPDQASLVKASNITGSTRLSGFDVNFGASFQHSFKSRKTVTGSTLLSDGSVEKTKSRSRDSLHLRIGVVYSPEVAVRGFESYVAETFFGSADFGTVRDTILFRDNEQGTIVMPSRLGGGFSLGSTSQKCLFTADYQLSNWDGFRMFGRTDSVRNAYRVSAGIQWVPGASLKGGGIRKAAYRLGGYYSDGYLRLNGKAIPETGITLGIGLPLEVPTYYRKPARSMVNLAITAGQRGAVEPNLIRERFVRVSLTFSLNDRWFIKTRFD